MNELPPPLRSSSDQDSFPSLPPGFLRQEEKGEKQALSPPGAQQGHGAALPARASPPHPCAGFWVLQTAAESCSYEMQIHLQDFSFH